MTSPSHNSGERLRRELSARKVAMRAAARPGVAAQQDGNATSDQDSRGVHHQILNAAMRNPAATAAIVFGVVGVLGPWRAVRLASKTAGLAAVARRILPSDSRNASPSPLTHNAPQAAGSR